MSEPQISASAQRTQHLQETSARREAHRRLQENAIVTTANEAKAAGHRPRSGMERFKAQFRGTLPGVD